MRFDDLTSDRTTIVSSHADTRRFGLSVERATVPLRAPAGITPLREAIDASDADVVIVRYPADRVGWFERLRSPGRELIFADLLVYWRLAVGTGQPPELDTRLASPAPQPHDIETFIATVFANYGNHYSANPLFSPELVAAGYGEWARTALQRENVVTVAANGELAGVATLTVGPSRAEIELAGIHPRYQNQGVYGHLLAAVERSVAASEIVISTQGHNVGVQRAWVRYGFEPLAAITTVHAVKSNLLPNE